MRHGKTRGAFFSDKYKRQRGSVKLSLPYLYMHFCNNRVKICGAVIKEKLNQNKKELFSKLKDTWSRTQLLIRMRKLYKRLPFRCAVNSGIVPRKRIEKTEQRSAALSFGLNYIVFRHIPTNRYIIDFNIEQKIK